MSSAVEHRRRIQPASGLWVIAASVGQFALTAFFSSIALAGGPASQAPCDEAAPFDGPAPESMPWFDPALAQRAELLLAQMTIGDNVDMATGELCGRYGFFNRAIPRVGIPALTMADGPAGVRINNVETNDGRATALPAAIALAATWDVALARTYGDVLGNEAFLTGHNVLLGPAVDMARAPLAGRAFETFGEDPFLAMQFAPHIVSGIQAYPVLANAKHFLVYTQEAARPIVDMRIGERALREIYLPVFETVFQANIASAMCSFNGVNGTPACENPLPTTLLKDELGFQGFVMSDYGATKSTVPAALNGLDQEQPGGTWFGEKLLAAVEAGEVPPARLDDMVRRILLTMFTFGLFDNPVQIAPLPVEEHAARARAIAEQAIVLLKNTENLLPLSGVQSIAVIGADADNVSAAGGGSSMVERVVHETSPLDGIIQRAGAGVSAQYAEGTAPITAGHLLPGPHPIPASVLAPAGGPADARGLLAQYWTNTDFNGAPSVERVDPQVAVNVGFHNFPGFNASSLERLPDEFSSNDFSARWTGTLTAAASGSHTLTLTSLGRGWVYLDGELVIDASQLHHISSQSATVELVAGEPHEIRVDYVGNRESASEAAYNANIGGQVALQWEPPAESVAPAVQEAAALAAASDVAIVFARAYETEDMDRPSLTLPNNQDQLIAQVVAANPRTIVVLMHAQPVTMPWIETVPAVLEAWYPGQEQGVAIAAVLFGDVNPSGKLPITFPISLEQNPTSTPNRYPGIDFVADVAEGIYVGSRWYDAQNLTPLFPFGFGLSYTTFGYSDLLVEDIAALTGGQQQGLRVSFTLTNAGQRAGAEIPQVYVGQLPVAVDTPPQQLAGFSRVPLQPGASQRVTVDVSPRSFSYWDEATHAWVAVTGEIPIHVGSSSRDIRLRGAGAATGGPPMAPAYTRAGEFPIR